MRHVPRSRVQTRFPSHVTLKVLPGVPSLRKRAVVLEIERSFTALCAARSDFRLVHYSIQSDHLHLLVEASDGSVLARGMKALGARLARAVNRVFRRAGAVLRDRYYLHVLRTPREVRNALRYVLLNVRKHARRALPDARVDPASSGRWFDGWLRVAPMDDGEPDARAVATARTWLLSVGWRRHGLIEPADVPG